MGEVDVVIVTAKDKSFAVKLFRPMSVDLPEVMGGKEHRVRAGSCVRRRTQCEVCFAAVQPLSGARLKDC